MSNRAAFVLTVLLATTITPGASEMAPRNAARQGIVLRLIHSGGHASTVVISDAGTATVTMAPLPPVRLRPVWDKGELRLEASIAAEDEVSALRTTTEPIVPDETAHLAIGGYQLDIEWLGTTSVATASFPGIGGGSESECCLMCEGIRICACRVLGSCGTCCTEACGPCAAATAR